MAGCRTLSSEEQALVLEHLSSLRDKCLFTLGLYTGLRLSELLSLRKQDVYRAGCVLECIHIEKKNTKGKTRSRDIPLHNEAKYAIMLLLGENPMKTPSEPLFWSRKGCGLTRHGAHNILKLAYERAGIVGPVRSLASHCMRKTFANKVYKRLEHDLVATKEALGHTDILNTIKYLDVNKPAINKAILD